MGTRLAPEKGNNLKEVRPETTDELLLDSTGIWRVFTRDSSHLFNFEKGTVTRERGPDAPKTVNDCTRPLRSIEACRVGERGRWTMRTDDWSETVDFYWAKTSVIRRIDKVSDRENLEVDHAGTD